MAQVLRELFTRKIKTYSIANQKLIFNFHFQNARIKKRRHSKTQFISLPHAKKDKKYFNQKHEMKI